MAGYIYKSDLPDIELDPTSPVKKAKKYRFMPLTEAIVIGISMFIAVISTTFFVYTHALNAQKGEIQDGLLRMAHTLSKFIDGDLHKSFTTREQEHTEAYKVAIEPLRKALEADPTIAFVYTIIYKEGQVHFILDPTPPGDSDGDGVEDKSHIMQAYPEATPEMLIAVKERKSIVEPHVYSDRWGSFLSGYVPFYDSDGNYVGVLGVDINADEYVERFNPIKRATIRAMVTGFFMAFLVGSLVWFMRHFSKVINNRRIALLNDLQAQLKEKEVEK